MKRKNSITNYIIFIGLVYLMLRISYVFTYDNVNSDNFITLICKRLIPIPFKLCFHPYSLFVIFIFVFLWARMYLISLRPKAQAKWKEKEHGSNEFQNKDDVDKFIKDCTDEIIPFSVENVNQILAFIKNNKKGD